jgi:4-amino-4-deoxy-L-arabinose transferase
MSSKTLTGLLIAFFTVLYLFPLMGHPLFIPDETRYAEIPREMVASGDWIVPRLNGFRYFEKPVMGYWLSAVSLSIFGENDFAVRLPSALSTGLTACLIFFLCSSCCSRKSRLPLLTTFVFITTLGVKAIASIAVLDTPLALFLTAALVMFFLATESKAGSSRERIFLLTAGLLAGCAFLTKGFLAFVVPVLAVAPYLLLQRRWTDLFRMLILPVIAALLVSMPWAVLINQQEPDFWNYFFWYEHVHRFLSNNAQHAKPYYYFLLVLPVMFMPWTMLLPAALKGFLKNRGKESAVKERLLIFCICWFLFPFLFFSSSSGKLMTYILPLFPPLVILFTFSIFPLLGDVKEKRSFIQWAIVSLLVLMLLVLISISGLHLFGPKRLWIFNRSWKWLLLASCNSAMIILLINAFHKKQKLHKFVLLGLSFGILLFTIQFTIPWLTLNRKAPGPLLSRHASQISPETYILSGENVIRAVCWYLKRDDVYLLGSSGELKYGAGKAASNSRRLLSADVANDFIREHKEQVVLVVDLRTYNNYWQPILPKPISIDSSGSRGFLFIRY